MDIGKAFVTAWNTYKSNFIVLILAGIVAALLGFLVAPMVGFQMMFVKAKRGEAIAFNDIFAPFSRFFSLLCCVIWIAFIVCLAILPSIICFNMEWNVAGIICLIAGIGLDLYLGIGWIFALLFIYDKKLSISAGLKASRALVTKNNWWLHLLLVILTGFVSGIGSALWGIGSILTMPLGTGALASAYADESK